MSYDLFGDKAGVRDLCFFTITKQTATFTTDFLDLFYHNSLSIYVHWLQNSGIDNIFIAIYASLIKTKRGEP